ncbi:hypothetical protein Dsin_004763 [Dipteronia sinensis]|uniref:Uncharacterized protein n=1 Tax=Dipteronia sinensis TaxID=43782 RepID=A0AAE0EE19_9ROSI|nr:hypothetical protein Dsin_004763 [Dipteronia sinensis]
MRTKNNHQSQLFHSLRNGKTDKVDSCVNSAKLVRFQNEEVGGDMRAMDKGKQLQAQKSKLMGASTVLSEGKTNHRPRDNNSESGMGVYKVQQAKQHKMGQLGEVHKEIPCIIIDLQMDWAMENRLDQTNQVLRNQDGVVFQKQLISTLSIIKKETEGISTQENQSLEEMENNHSEKGIALGIDFKQPQVEDESHQGSVDKWNLDLEAKLVDMPLNRITFTWSNNRDQASWAHLDRFLILQWIISWFPNLIQMGLPKCVSDHSDVVLGEPRQDWGPIPFRFYNDWLENDEMMKQAVEGWMRCKVNSPAGFFLACKTKATKRNLRNFIELKKSDLSTVKKCENRLEVVERGRLGKVGPRPLENGGLTFYRNYGKVLGLEEQRLHQKSMIKWLKEGDRNSKFFYCVANSRKRMNFIEGMNIGGVMVTGTKFS